MIGDRWTLLILRDLILRGFKTYKEFLGAKEQISTNILADRLAKLEEFKLISKKDDPENGKQYLYAPTKKALDLLPLIVELGKWSAKYHPQVCADNIFVKRVPKDQKGFMTKILSQFEDVI
jgi:DNA-binding HxlR family transcriptional regulator